MRKADERLSGAKILIVDDEQANVRLLERILELGGFTQVRSTTDPRQVLSLFVAFRPDLILLDLNMPHMDGFQVLQQLSGQVPAGAFLPVLVLTADVTGEARNRALTEGASDFLTKPFDHTEALLRIGNLLETRLLHLELEEERQRLADRVWERTEQLEDAQLETLRRLALAAEYRDDDTFEHTNRVGDTSAAIAAELGWSADQTDLLRRAAPLHDVGKLGTPDGVLLKPGKLTDEEFEVIREHITIGARILSGSRSPVLQMAEVIALAHHERWDGSGYLKLTGEDIPLTAQVVAVADVFDALTHARPYKEAWTDERAFDEMVNQRGRHFAPEPLDAFLRHMKSQGRYA